MASKTPRAAGAGGVGGLRDGPGSRTAARAPVQTKLARSAVKATSIAGIFARLRMHPATARLNGSCGACNFAGGFLLELITVISAAALLKSCPRVADARRHASTHDDIYRALRQLLAKTALIEFRDECAFQFVAFV